jgi:hypothetical protein
MKGTASVSHCDFDVTRMSRVSDDLPRVSDDLPRVSDDLPRVGPDGCGPVTATGNRRQVSPSTLPRRGTWGRRSWAGSCSTSTGGRTTAGSAAPSPVSARAARSRTRRRTRARRRRCAARRTLSLSLSLSRCAAGHSPLDSASYGARRVLLSPAPAAGVVAGSRARRPRPQPSVWSVARHSSGPPGRARRLRSRDRNRK